MHARTRAHLPVLKPLRCAIAEPTLLLFRPRLDRYSKSQIPSPTRRIPSVARDRLQIRAWRLGLGIWVLGMDGAACFQLHGALPRRRAARTNNSDHDREV